MYNCQVFITQKLYTKRIPFNNQLLRLGIISLDIVLKNCYSERLEIQVRTNSIKLQDSISFLVLQELYLLLF